MRRVVIGVVGALVLAGCGGAPSSTPSPSTGASVGASVGAGAGLAGRPGQGDARWVQMRALGVEALPSGWKALSQQVDPSEVARNKELSKCLGVGDIDDSTSSHGTYSSGSGDGSLVVSQDVYALSSESAANAYVQALGGEKGVGCEREVVERRLAQSTGIVSASVEGIARPAGVEYAFKVTLEFQGSGKSAHAVSEYYGLQRGRGVEEVVFSAKDEAFPSDLEKSILVQVQKGLG